MVAALLAFSADLGRAQDRAWDESIDSARRALASKQFDQAERILRRARSQSRGFQPGDPRRVVPLMELAKLHLNRGDYALPEQLYREADPIARDAWGAESQEYASLVNDIGRYYHLRVRFDEAERFHKLAFGIRVRLLGREHPDVGASVNNLAILYENLVLYPKAETYYRTALAIREKSLGTEHPDTILTLEHFARLLHKLSRPDEAAGFEQRARNYRTAQSESLEAVDIGAVASSNVDQPPMLLERPEPDYTDEARIANHEGSVLLQTDVDSEGNARNIVVIRHLGLGLDEQAIQAVRRWRFRPARRNGQRVACRVRLEIAFRVI
jgi:TonB family protein